MWQILLSEKFPPTGFMKGKYKSGCLVSGATLSCARSFSLAVAFIRVIIQHCRGCTSFLIFTAMLLEDSWPFPSAFKSLYTFAFLSEHICLLCISWPAHVGWQRLNQCDTEIWGSLSPRANSPQSTVRSLKGFVDKKDEKELAELCFASEPSLVAFVES